MKQIHDFFQRSLYSKKDFVAASIDDFEQPPFIINELNLEIKTEGQELIQNIFIIKSNMSFYAKKRAQEL